ncbi:MAG: Holliday junction ATP-dependent DNA helicase RuvB [Candidatus Uhrbacteria bacterium GW2011_GWD2_41_121]|uniref:Holliday junction branch migration complex subunit RuvB n=1 Tax=Candidatus Uhrbacteria bacterium GW2011_GWC1_41_20 TaxID=1618983 RepID=A0A0G0YBJ3_9BACT|nr:MAG: Holliday junction ATP-dependent DNA helicase RuvB [Candidatus Uhrbacteria bacterium GW2011_GWE1_39_46]KKR63385.1 MAG: Holliday junction ATP-dependent DNA helicase RuvB [Candidatus Uhrbacteria bacterium GW2011_GWC2_40_450]KKR88224.1 MAG: Holliday junction ATP-dependent DNA helicase RuvB [Candidatus Uhrbacteria bacterium GW2011_GWE2_41_1153]KKR89620.1 MAG: Holliday junction ATP-dependent DNA helicase RuvB [Candidatus Uhrbacteria bacterium GW2011_GWD2_41_121]KKR95377.1 MAG: Holliday juncti
MIESNFEEDSTNVREVSKDQKDEEINFEATLRPRSLDEFIGQKDLKEGLNIFIHAAKKRGEPIDHTLLYGNPGLGKTTLAHIIANEMEGNIRITSGPALERVGDLAAILSNLQEGDILFIDEIHRMNRSIEEVLYPAMEDFALDLVVGKGPSARTLRLGLEKFTIIGATTRPSLLSSPLRDRFGSTYRLDFYSDSEMSDIVSRSAKILGVKIDQETCQTIAKRSRQTPRIANRLLKRVRDYSQVKHDGLLSSDIANSALNMLAIDELGLDGSDRRVLKIIIDKFNGGPVGLSTLAAATQEERETLEEIFEPFLLQLGFLERTPRGRVVTEKAYKHMGYIKPIDTLL